MKKILLLISIIVSLQNLALASEIVIINSCEEDKIFADKVRAGSSCSKCVDGWDSLTYYDGRLVSKDLEAKLYPNMISLPKELDKATIAITHKSVCDCQNPVSYQIFKDEQRKEVDCGEFYKFIQDYNSKCGNCLKAQSAGCC